MISDFPDISRLGPVSVQSIKRQTPDVSSLLVQNVLFVNYGNTHYPRLMLRKEVPAKNVFR